MEKTIEILNKYIDFSKDGVIERENAVKLKKGDTTWKVTEIRLTQYVAAKTAEIHLQLLDEYDGTKIWRTADKIEKRVAG